MPRCLVVLLACLLLAGCGGFGGLDDTGDEGYVSGNGTIAELKPSKRGGAIALSGEDLEGDDVSLADLRGKVVVINTWGSWCGDCHQEEEDFVAAANKLMGDDVAFLGINTRDTTGNAQAFVRMYDVPFPSVFDPDGEALLAFRGKLAPNATPSTLILDREGRIAARVLGPIPTTQTLVSLVETVVSERG